MKKSTIMLMPIALIITISSCSRNEVPDNTTEELNDYTAMTVNGIRLVDDTSGGGFISGSNLASIGGDFGNSTLAITFSNAVVAGDFDLSSANGDFAGYTITTPSSVYSLGNSGSWITVTITDIYAGTLKGLKGTFEGVLYNAAGESITITDGEFEDH